MSRWKGSSKPSGLSASGWWKTDRPRELERVLVAEPANAAERPEVGVERAVLLHEDDDVLDRAEAAPARTDLRERIEYASGTERADSDSGSRGEQFTSR